MKLKISLYHILILFLPLTSFSQETYTISRAPFSGKRHSEFSPVFYKDKIVFSGNRKSTVAGFTSIEGEGFFNIYCVDSSSNKKGKVKLFSRDLKSRLNDGPLTFSSGGDTVYFSRNLIVKGSVNELSSVRNKLGIFMAVMQDGRWTRIREFRYNNEWYNVSTPFLSHNGQRLYFSSDKPGGYGGSDLYYCEWKDGFWDEPVNLGPEINTPGNEAYPYINSSGELFFSSDGHPGQGGKDIFVSKQQGNKWLKPVALDPPINSEFDDFGIITDTLVNEGYFSSNREGTLSIYHFATGFPQIFYSDFQKENQHCFLFQDSGSVKIDTTHLKLRWDLGDGTIINGDKVRHCYSAPGNYRVKLDVFDRKSGKKFFSKLEYELQLKDYEQAYISSPDYGSKDVELEFSALQSNLPGNLILDFAWDFGDGHRVSGEPVVNHTYTEAGEYNVSLILTIRSESSGTLKRTIVTKPVAIFNNPLEAEVYAAGKGSGKISFTDIRDYENAFINTLWSAESNYTKDAVFRVEVLVSPTKVSVNDRRFKNIPSKYSISERFYPVDSMYHYFADQQMELMFTCQAFNDILNSGYKDVSIKLHRLRDPIERELYTLKRNYGTMADEYFDRYGSISSTAYLFLDQIVILMNRNPDIKMEVGVHTDNLGTEAANLKLSQTRAQTIANYLINRGISPQRLKAVGYGSQYPVAPNVYEADRRFNRRLDFKLIK